MLLYENAREGHPIRLYRDVREVRSDMTYIRTKIKAAEEMLTVRGLVMDLVGEWSLKDPKKWIRELEESVEEAREALDSLNRLYETLSELEDELAEINAMVLR